MNKSKKRKLDKFLFDHDSAKGHEAKLSHGGYIRVFCDKNKAVFIKAWRPGRPARRICFSGEAADALAGMLMLAGFPVAIHYVDSGVAPDLCAENAAPRGQGEQGETR